MRAANNSIFTNADMSQAVITSAPIQLFNCFGYAVQLVFTGSPVGTFTVKVSCDPFPANQSGVASPSHFTLLADSDLLVSGAGDLMYNVNECNYNWFQVIYTKTSGTGTLNGTFNLKGF